MLVDCHVHIALDGRDSKKWRQLIAEKNYEPVKTVLELYKNKGIMAIRDGGDNYGISLVAREIAKSLGITFRSPGWAIYKKGMYGTFLGKPVMGIEDFKDLFIELLKVKVDHLKIILTGLVEFECYGKVGEIGFSEEELNYMVQSAKEKGLPVMVHANSSIGVKMAIEAGADTIEHGYFLTDEELYMMADKGVVWVPTLAPLGNILEKEEFRAYYSDKIKNIKKIFDGHLNAIKKALSLGVKVAIGSDSGSLGVYHAQGFFDEVRYFKRCGICEEDVYKMAHKNGIKVVGLDSGKSEF
ncbi:amidohydrolase family protein [Thermovorax subterraneus]|nr:amidohydrolase family protein [Thermovorax subterraneus]